MVEQDIAPPAASGAPGQVQAGAWYALAVLMAIYTMNALDRSVMSVLIEPVKKAFHLNDGQAGALNTLTHSVGLALGTIPLGLLSDRVNRVKLIAALTAVWSALTLTCGAVPSALFMALARTGVGASEGGFSPAALSLLTDFFPLHRRSAAIGFFYVSTALGTGIIFLAGSWVASHYGWRAGFMIAGAPGLVLGALLFLTVREPLRGRYEPGGPTRKAGLTLAARTMVRDPAIIFGILGTALGIMTVASVLAWGVSFLIRRHGLTLPQAGFWVAMTVGPIQGVASALTGLLADRVAAGHPRRIGVVPASALLASVPIGLTLLYAPGTGLAVAALMLFGACMGGWLAQGFATILACAEPDMRGGMMGIAQVCVNLLGAGAGPWIAGMISHRLGDNAASLQTALTVMVLLSAPAALLLMLAARRAAPISPVDRLVE